MKERYKFLNDFRCEDKYKDTSISQFYTPLNQTNRLCLGQSRSLRRELNISGSGMSLACPRIHPERGVTRSGVVQTTLCYILTGANGFTIFVSFAYVRTFTNLQCLYRESEPLKMSFFIFIFLRF